MDENTTITAIIGALSTLGGVVLTYITQKNKTLAEEENITINTLEKVDKINETLLNRVLRRLEEVERENQELLEELKKIREMNQKTQEKIKKVNSLLQAIKEECIPRIKLEKIIN